MWRVLGLPDGYLAVYIIGLSYPADRPPRRCADRTAGRPTRSCTGTTGNTRTSRGLDSVTNWLQMIKDPTATTGDQALDLLLLK
jgi:hypothetical protein